MILRICSFLLATLFIHQAHTKSPVQRFIDSPQEFKTVGKLKCKLCDGVSETSSTKSDHDLPNKKPRKFEVISIIDPKSKSEYHLYFESSFSLNNRNKTPTIGKNLGFTNTSEFVTLMSKNIPGATRDGLLSMEHEDLLTKISDAFNLTTESPSYNRILFATTLIEASSASNTDDFLNVFQNRTKSLNEEEKISFMRYLLFQFGDNYDDSRAEDDHPNSSGKVPLNQIKNALFENIYHKSEIKAGVCRDIVQAGLLIAKAIGLENSFGIGYQTTGGSSHREFMTVNLEDKKITVINYDIKSDTKDVRGVKALEINNGSPSTGIQFRLTSEKNIEEIALPSELGLTLHHMVDGNQDQIMLGDNPLGDTHQVGLKIKNLGEARLFYSESNQGSKEQTFGLSISRKQKFFDIAQLDLGVAAFSSTRPTYFTTLKSRGFYFSAVPHLVWDKTLGPVSIHLDAGIAMRSHVGCNQQGSFGDCEYNQEGAINAFSKAKVTIKVLPNTSLSLFSKSIIDNHYTDSTDNSTDQGFKTTMYSIGSDLEFKNNKIAIHLGGEVFYYDLGDGTFKTTKASASVSYLPSSTLLRYTATNLLDETNPIFLPNIDQTSRLQLKQSVIFLPVNISVDGEYNHDNPNLSLIMLTIGNN